MLYRVDPSMSVAEISLLKAKKVAEVEAFVKNDIAYDEGFLIEYRMLYVAYKMFCKRNNVFMLRRCELWAILHDMGYTTMIVDGKRPCWVGLVPKYVKVNSIYQQPEEGEADETND